jgi:hypothetical protein
MDIQDGFIVGIFNYCDSWCASCGFTSRCRVFADTVQLEAAVDPTLKPLIDARLLPDVPPDPPPWMQELIEQASTFALETRTDRRDCPSPAIVPDHAVLREHASTYFDWVLAWLRTHEAFAVATDPRDPRAVVSWLYSMIDVKVRRALHGLAEDDPSSRNWPADYDGSAKVALLAVERSQVAWLQIVERGHATWADAEPFVRRLLSLRHEIEGIFPGARAFVRPGFDEPDDVAKLLASEGV